MSKNIAVFGIYSNRESIEEAMAELRLAGFRDADTSVMFGENRGTKELAHEKGSKAPEGFTVGACFGAIVGAVLGWLAGLGMWEIPQLESAITAGPLLGLLAGIGAGGLLGGAVGALVGKGIPEYQAMRYKGRLRKGGILLSVHCDNSAWVERAKAALSRTGAVDIAAASEKRADYAVSDIPMNRRTEWYKSAMPVLRKEKTHSEAHRPATRYTHTEQAEANSNEPEDIAKVREHEKSSV